MLIIGIDGADYRVASDYANIAELAHDGPSLHTVPSWTTIFDVEGRVYERPERYNEPLDADFIWDHTEGDWTIGNVPITFPTFDYNCEVPEKLGKPNSEAERHHERLTLSEVVGGCDTEHTLVVVNGLDALSHECDDMDTIKVAYELTLRWADSQRPDVVLSDHGFENFGGGEAVDDHSRHAIVAGLDARRLTEVGPELHDRLVGSG